MSEAGERLPKGPKGPKGDKGERGERGMAPSARRAVIYLFALTLVLAVANLLWTSHEVYAAQAAQHREQMAQQRQGEILGRRLCQTFGDLAALKPPAGNPAANPSRAYEDGLHARLDQLGTDLGCR